MSAELHEFQPHEVMAYLDGEVTGERALALADHLENCPECSSLADDFCALSQQLTAWRIQPSPLVEPTANVDPEVPAEQEAEMVCAEFPHGLPRSNETAAASLTTNSLIRRPWVWALGSACAAMLILLLGSFRMLTPLRHPAPATLSASAKSQSVERSGTTPIRQAPSAGLDIAGQRARNSTVAVDGADAVDNSVNGIRASVPDQETVTQRRIDNLPINGRKYIDFTHVSSQTTTSPLQQVIERTASLSLIVTDMDASRIALEGIAKQHEGYFAELNTTGQSDAGRTLTAALRVPASKLDAALVELRKLGRLDEEKQGGEEVSRQFVDLNARLNNARKTEKRLTELLTRRAAKLKDVLDVDRDLASTREEIERMEAQQRNMENQVEFASIDLKLHEEYKPALNLAPLAAGTRLRNALVDGYQSAVESALGLVLFLFQDGPSILFWLLLLFLPARWTWRKLRLAIAPKQSLAGVV